LLGAMHGMNAIPARWLDGLELRGCIEDMAGELAALFLSNGIPHVVQPHGQQPQTR
jgi:hypothetical protein